MPKKYVHTEIEGHKIKLSNLDKVIYPSINISKAEIIQYYLHISSYILPHISGRPLTVIRFPDGIDKQSFYSKDKPNWTPDWVDSTKIQHEDKEIDYVICSDQASLIWLANLACLELHPMQFQMEHEFQPDHFIFDLDPDESVSFEQVKECALALKPFLESYGYTPYIKTSGGKGFHIYVPIKPLVAYEKVTESVKKLGKLFVAKDPKKYTLAVNKARRKGKILIDIYRNHLSNTTVSPFSLRGKPGAPISMPIRWEDLQEISVSGIYTIENYREYLDTHGHAWQDWRDHEVELHDQLVQQAVAAVDNTKLADYLEKRNFDQTPEPIPKVGSTKQKRFVIQLHDAQNLHYDLRLEKGGILLSWAVPKGLPYQKGVKRLAIQTEAHPIKYLDFEGVIPKGQYGAGDMWILEKGTIKWIKKKEDSYEFILSTRKQLTYKIFKTKNAQWLLECEPKINSKLSDYKPMLADAGKNIPNSKDYFFEVKWDGIRVLIYVKDEQIRIMSRSGRDITKQFPELQIPERFRVEEAVLDGEIVVLDKKGAPVFADVISRMHQGGETAIKKASQRKPVVCYLFDILRLDGKDVTAQTNTRRREWLDCILKQGERYRFSTGFEDGATLFAAIEAQGMEGIMAKEKKGAYGAGSRTRNWLKIKSRTDDQAWIIGYSKGKGDRSDVFGALHLVKMEEDNYQYMGKVGTGFDSAKLKELYALFSEVPKTVKPIKDAIEEEHRTVWIEPKYKCALNYASLTSNGTYREPVFVKLVSADTDT